MTKYDYEENSPWGTPHVSGIETVAAAADDLRLTFNAATRSVSCSASLTAADCRLVDLAGRSLPCQVVDSDCGSEILLPDCPAGIYVLRAADAALKLALK